MEQDEQFVREMWVDCCVEDHSTCCGPFEPIRVRMTDSMSRWAATAEQAWSAAAEFTRERLEQIRQVEEEVSVITHEYKKATVCGVFMGAATGKALIWQRVLAREHAALTELKKGMR
jgi:hypothetical protein